MWVIQCVNIQWLYWVWDYLESFAVKSKKRISDANSKISNVNERLLKKITICLLYFEFLYVVILDCYSTSLKENKNNEKKIWTQRMKYILCKHKHTMWNKNKRNANVTVEIRKLKNKLGKKQTCTNFIKWS